MLRKIYDRLFKIIEIICIVFVLAMIGVVTYMVVMRYIFNNSPRWGDEIALFCMLWIGLLSAAIAMKENRHIRITLWEKVLSTQKMKVLEVVVHIIVSIILVFLMKYGYDMVKLSGGTVMTGSGIPLKYLYYAVPVSAFFILIATIGRIGEIIGHKR